MDEILRPVPIGARLRDACLRLNLTQQDVADRLGVSRTVITAIEAGRRAVRAEEIVALAEILGIKVSDLVRESHAVARNSVHFRALRKLEQDLVPLTESTVDMLLQYASDYVHLEELCDVEKRHHQPQPYDISGLLPHRAGAFVARAERARLGLGTAPIPAMRDLLEQTAGVRILVTDLPHPISALFVYDNHCGGCIALNEAQPVERNRWNCAHEYGHYLVSRHEPDLIAAQPNNSQIEQAVEEFAKHFLLPAEGINASFDALMSQNQSKITPVDILSLAVVYGVSFQAMTYRLEELGRLRTGTWDALHSHGFRVRETQQRYGIRSTADDFPRYPRRFRVLLLKAMADAKLSEGEAARIVGGDRLVVRQLVNETLEELGVEEIDDITLNLTERVR